MEKEYKWKFSNDNSTKTAFERDNEVARCGRGKGFNLSKGTKNIKIVNPPRLKKIFNKL